MSAAGAILAALLAVAVLGFASRAVGAWLIQPLPVHARGQFRMLAGLGAVGVGLFLIGMVVWRRWLLLMILLPLAAWGACDWRRQARVPRWGRLRERFWRGGYGWVLAVSPLLVYLALDACVPPMGNIGNDVVAYHLVGPMQWLRVHHIAALLDNFPTTYPALVETLFGSAMAISNVRAAQIVAFVFGLLLLQQLYGLVRDLGGDAPTAGLAVALLACMPAVMEYSTVAFVDLAFAAFALAAVRLAWAARGRPDWMLAGAMLGFAIGTKYTGLLLLLGTLMALWLLRRSHPAGAPGRYLCWLTGTALAVGSAWYIRNAIVFWTPIYPLPLVAGNHWPGRYISAASVRAFENYMVVRGAGMGRSIVALLLFPFHYTYDTYLFHGAGGIGVAPLAFGPIAVWALWRSPPARFWLFWSLIIGVLWFYSQQESRYLIPVVTVWAAFAAVAATGLWRRGPGIVRALVALALTASMAYGAGTLIWDGGQRPVRIASLFSRARAVALWNREVPYAEAFAFLNRENGGRVLVLDSRALIYYLHRPYLVIAGPYGEKPLGAMTDAQALTQLRALGITEVLDVRSDGSTFRVARPGRWLLHLEFSSANARVYGVDP